MKKVLVTGASGNLGRALVERFVSGGYYVSASVIQGDPVEFPYPQDQFERITVDMLNGPMVQEWVEDFTVRKGNIDAALLTVGGFAMGAMKDTTAGDIYHQYQLNFETAYNVARPVFAQMLKQGSGRIFMTGSKPGLSTIHAKGMVAYSLAKSLIFRLAELMNEEARGSGVVTTVVVPSTIDTPQNRQAMPGAHFENWVTPQSIADIIYWHCSKEASSLREPVLKVYNGA